MDSKNPPTSPTPPSIDTIKEKLAAIEHERWADWQKWCHQVLRQELPVEVLPFLNDMVLARWERQIDTPYEALSDKEKASDVEQVDRYWPLILTLFESIMLEVIGSDEPDNNASNAAVRNGYRNELRVTQRTKAAAALERLRNG